MAIPQHLARQGVTAAEWRGGGPGAERPLAGRPFPHRHVRVPEEDEKRKLSHGGQAVKLPTSCRSLLPDVTS
jgi:hypothetical protein